MRDSVTLDHLVARMEHVVGHRLIAGDPFSLQFEKFTTGEGVRSWRALLKLAQIVWASSKDDHTSPTGALLELVEILEERHVSHSRAPPG